MNLSEIKTFSKQFAMVDVNADYESANGRDINKDFKVAVDCDTEEQAQKFFDEMQKILDADEIIFDADSNTDADDIANTSVYSHSITTGSGITAKPPKGATVVKLKDFKITPRSKAK